MKSTLMTLAIIAVFTCLQGRAEPLPQPVIPRTPITHNPVQLPKRPVANGTKQSGRVYRSKPICGVFRRTEDPTDKNTLQLTFVSEDKISYEIIFDEDLDNLSDAYETLKACLDDEKLKACITKYRTTSAEMDINGAKIELKEGERNPALTIVGKTVAPSTDKAEDPFDIRLLPSIKYTIKDSEIEPMVTAVARVNLRSKELAESGKCDQAVPPMVAVCKEYPWLFCMRRLFDILQECKMKDESNHVGSLIGDYFEFTRPRPSGAKAIIAPPTTKTKGYSGIHPYPNSTIDEIIGGRTEATKNTYIYFK